LNLLEAGLTAKSLTNNNKITYPNQSALKIQENHRLNIETGAVPEWVNNLGNRAKFEDRSYLGQFYQLNITPAFHQSVAARK
jgi:hypothetical protein